MVFFFYAKIYFNMINNNGYNLKKDKLLSIHMLAIIGFMLALIISYLLTLDKKLSLENKKRLFSNKEAQNLALFQSILIFVVASTFLYTNYNQYKISKETHDNDEQDLFLQIETSIFAIISAIIGLYIIFKNYRGQTLTISETENV